MSYSGLLTTIYNNVSIENMQVEKITVMEVKLENTVLMIQISSCISCTSEKPVTKCLQKFFSSNFKII